MAIESYEVHTVVCDIPGCKEKRTSNSIKSFRDEGWFHVQIFQNDYEVCPEHQLDLREFFITSSES